CTVTPIRKMRPTLYRRLCPTSRLFATEATPSLTNSGSSNPLKPAPLALLPPLPLYRRLFRAHRRHLPPEERLLGDQYIRHEFRAHRDVENPAHIIGFLTEWQLYAQKLEGDSWRGDKMEEGKIEKLSDEQVGQLYELMLAVQRHGTGDGEQEG
ncbi:MAG: hypothetical protein Q9159_007292, partial [Coniocarpon cinnabarinum]